MIRTPSLGGSLRLSSWRSWSIRTSLRRVAPTRPGDRASGSDLEQLLFLLLERLVDLRLLGVGELVELLLGTGDVVLGGVAGLREPVELVAGGPAQVADGDAPVLGHALHHPDEVLAALRRELREHEPDDLTVVARVEAEVGVLDRLLDRAERSLVVRADDEHACLGHLEAGDL